MATLPTPTNYTDREQSSMVARLKALWGSVWPPLPDDASDPTITMLESFAWTFDNCSYYINDTAREQFMVFCRRYVNGLAHSRFLGYQPLAREAATVDQTFTLARIPTSPVTIPAGSTVSTVDLADPVTFQLLADIVIEAATSPPVAVGSVSNSRRTQETFDVSGEVNLQIPLRNSPVIESSIVVADNAGTYTRAAGFAGYGATDRVYVLEMDEFERATILTGDGDNGATPTGSLTVSYRTGGGSAGNIEAGTLERFNGVVLDALGRQVTLSTTNAAAASGGTDRETLASIKLNAPAALRTQKRSTTADDFEVNARRVAGVARVLMLTRNLDLAVDENTGHLLIVPTGGGLPSQALKDAVESLILTEYPPPLTFVLRVLDPMLVTIDVEARVFIDPDFVGATVRQSITANLETFFDPLTSDGTPNEQVDFGARLDEVTWSDVFNVIRDTTGVRSMSPSGLTLNGLLDNIGLVARGFPVLGNVVIRDAQTGAIL